ncbi:zinc finger protein 84-like [Pectinophora gossypiella]|uniref:zinc finger protein 84-like n=1 Tax=Pectinophora gossypiella TaxID=13191 RepID=UPI00214DF16F|nr:zinc finger protein 84-like [Pectinophora gossypiella]
MDSNMETDPNITSMKIMLKRSVLPKNKMAIILETEQGPQYCCVQCPVRFYEKEKLELHLCTHFKEYRFLCGVCGTGMKRKEHLIRHTLGHQEIRPHVCPECGKGFKRKEHLNIHQSIHTGDKTQVCSLCHRSFYRKDHLQKHLQTHSKIFMEQNMFQLSDQELLQIKQEVLEDDVKPVIDDEAGCEPVMEMSVENNTATENGTPQVLDPERPFICFVCNKSYKRKDHLKLHSQTHLKKEQVCSECGKSFHKEEQLLAHMNVHLLPYPMHINGDVDVSDMQSLSDNSGHEVLHADPQGLLIERAAPVKRNPESRPHQCPVCHRRFKRRQHLKVHANVHLKLPPTIWCSLCNMGFQSNSQFESHDCQPGNGENEEQTGAKKENDYPQYITPATEDASPLENSALLAEQLLPTPQRVYVCKYCTKPFKRKDHYKIHLHIHTGIKSFFCPDCGKGFYRKDHLQKHAQIHQKNKPKPNKKMIPDLFPIHMLSKEIKPEITITAPSNSKLRVPLQIKVPYQMVMSMDNGEQRAVTIDPQASGRVPVTM